MALAWLRKRKDKYEGRFSRLEALVSALGSENRGVSALQIEHDKLVERVAALRGDHDNISAEHNRLVERVAVLRASHNNLEQRLLDNSRVLPDGADNSTARFLTRNSYSIEAEDLLVDTAFHVVLKQFTTGVYLDIGAAHPVESSNTYYFYKRGWRGICVEPNPDFCSLYPEFRPHDKLYNIGLSSKAGTFQYNTFEHAYLNGFYGQDIVDWHISVNKQKYLGCTELECREIGEFLENEISSSIDFLNIDVETLDEKILSAWRWDICKPTVICAEIHSSDIRNVLESPIVHILEAAGYSAISRGWLSAIFVRRDKLNGLVILGKQ